MGGRNELVTGELLDEEAIERQVGVEGPHDPVAVFPSIGTGGIVLRGAGGIGVAGVPAQRRPWWVLITALLLLYLFVRTLLPW